MAPAAAAPVLVIGRHGQVASALQRLAPALSQQRPVVMAGRPELDLAAPRFGEQLAVLLEDVQPAVLINAAAYTAVDRAESEPELAMAVNGDAVGSMAKACGERGIPMFHLSTDYVFDGSGETAWAPGDPTAPLGVYGASKLQGEWLLQETVRQQGLRALVLRVSWVFGQQGGNFVRTMLRLAAERNALQVVADQIGGPTSAESIARALLLLVEPALANVHPVRGSGESFPWGTHHFQGQPVVSWHGFAGQILRQAAALHLLDQEPVLTPICTTEFPTPARRPANSRLDCRTAGLELGLELPAWRDDLRECLLAAAKPSLHA